jgi:hypothetical protein
MQDAVFLLGRKMPARQYRVSIRISKGFCHCDRLSSSRHRLLNLPDTRPTTATLAQSRTEGWADAYRSSRTNILYKLENQGMSNKNKVISITFHVFQYITTRNGHNCSLLCSRGHNALSCHHILTLEPPYRSVSFITTLCKQ